MWDPDQDKQFRIHQKKVWILNRLCISLYTVGNTFTALRDLPCAKCLSIPPTQPTSCQSIFDIQRSWESTNPLVITHPPPTPPMRWPCWRERWRETDWKKNTQMYQLTHQDRKLIIFLRLCCEAGSFFTVGSGSRCLLMALWIIYIYFFSSKQTSTKKW